MKIIKKLAAQEKGIKKFERDVIHLKKPLEKFQHSAFQTQPHISPNRLELLCGESSIVASM